MKNVKRSTFYILAACLAVFLLCCCVIGIYFAFRGEGRGVLKADALDETSASQFASGYVDVTMTNSSGFYYGGLTRNNISAYVSDQQTDSVSLITLISTALRTVLDSGYSLGSITIADISFYSDTGFTFSDESVFYFFQPFSFNEIEIFTDDFDIQFYGDSDSSYGVKRPVLDDAGDTVGFYAFPPAAGTYSKVTLEWKFLDFTDKFRWPDEISFDADLYMSLPGAVNVDLIKLDTPSLSIDGDLLFWTAVPHASYYNIYMDGEDYDLLVTDTTYNVGHFTVPVYKSFTVRAIGDHIYYADSDLSNAVIYDTTDEAPQLDSPTLYYNDFNNLLYADCPTDAIYLDLYWSADGIDYSKIHEDGLILNFTVTADYVPGYFYCIARGGGVIFKPSEPSNVIHITTLDPDPPDPDPPDPDPPDPDVPDIPGVPSSPEILSGGSWTLDGTWVNAAGDRTGFIFRGSSLSDFLTDDGYGLSASKVYNYAYDQFYDTEGFDDVDTLRLLYYPSNDFVYDPVRYQFLYLGSPLGVSVYYNLSYVSLYDHDDDRYSAYFDDPFIVLPTSFTGTTVTCFGFGFSGAYNSASGDLYLFDYITNIGYDVGYDLGHDAGYNSGLTDGYDNGFNAALNDSGFMSLMTAVVDAPIKAFMGLFDIEIMGFNIAGVLIAILSIALVTKVIALFM